MLVEHMIVEDGNAVHPLLLAEVLEEGRVVFGHREASGRVVWIEGQALVGQLLVAGEVLYQDALPNAQEDAEHGGMLAQDKLGGRWGDSEAGRARQGGRSGSCSHWRPSTS